MEPIYLEYLKDTDGRKKEKKNRIESFAMIPYYSLKDGNIEGVMGCKALIASVDGDPLSSDELLSKRYLFVSSTTMASVFAMQGGMPAEDAAALKNLYIGRMDDCETEEAIDELHTIMFLDFTRKVQDCKAAEEEEESSSDADKMSRNIAKAIDYIRQNLHTKLSLEQIAKAVSLSPNYLATRFHKETGSTVQDYIRDLRIDVAQTMLKDSDYTLTEIARCLGFGSNSHFIKVFREKKTITPKQYRLKHYN